MSDTTLSAAPRPAPGPPRAYSFPRFEAHTLDNGLRVLVAPVHKLPIVSVTLLIDAGSTAEVGGSDGVASLTARALLEGTDTMSGADLTIRAETLGASLNADADWDAATVSTTVLSSRLREALALLASVVLRPAFPAHDVDRLKAERLAEILQVRAEPRGLADEMLGRFVYDEASRFSRPELGSAAVVASLNRDDLAQFHGERYRPGVSTLIFAGNVSAIDALKLTRELLGGWRGQTPTPSATTDLPARRARAVHIVEKHDAPQSELRVGHVGLTRANPDYFPLTVMNAVLGGLFSSRINLNLREAHGYTYGAFSGFDWRRQAGPFTVQSAVRTDATVAAAGEIIAEVDRIRSEAIAERELSLAADYLAGVFPIRYETTSDIARALSALVVYGLPIDYFDRYRANITAVTADDVLRVAREHLHPEELQIVIVGDPAQVRVPLEAMQFGPVTVYDAEGSIKT
ncbi:MAG: insulinase family protein [Gemmatimonadota bacterium]|nr:insulinase family protein [Gemmatimonadota bacterium]